MNENYETIEQLDDPEYGAFASILLVLATFIFFF